MGTDEHIRELLAEADRHRADALEHLRLAQLAQVAARAAGDQAAAAMDQAITSYDDYLRRYLPDEYERRQMAADPQAEGERRARKAIADALELLLGEGGTDGN